MLEKENRRINRRLGQDAMQFKKVPFKLARKKEIWIFVK